MFRKMHPPVGSRPGTLMLSEDALPPRIHVMQYRADSVTEQQVTDPSKLRALLTVGDPLWIDVQGLGDEGMLRVLAEMFSIHPLALEDVVNVPQRPTTDAYDHHQLYISRMARVVEDKLVLEQVSIFFSDKYVLTFQDAYGDVLDPVRQRIREGLGPIRKSGLDYLAYAIIDTIIDGFYPAMEGFSDELEDLEERVIKAPTPETLSAVNRLKKSLLDLRRGIAPQREATNALVRGDSPFVTDSVRVYLRDSYDHCVQIVDVIEGYRELASGLMNTYLSSVSNRTNDVMKVLTIMASIFIPLTFLAGIYGMNFESMPELRVRWFYPVLLGVMLAVAGGMLLYFRRKGWIGGGDR